MSRSGLTVTTVLIKAGKMMSKPFIVYGTILCLLLAFANYNGMGVGDLMSGKWKPKGKQGMYHK